MILDEPTTGLDPRARHEIRQLIASLNQSGTVIVFTSHDMEEVSKIAHRVVMLSHGQVLAEGTPNQLCQDFLVPNLEELYLSKNEWQASIYSNILAMPMLFLSSAFYSLETGPAWIKTLNRLNPFSHFVSGLYSTLVFELWETAINLLFLLACGVLALASRNPDFSPGFGLS